MEIIPNDELRISITTECNMKCEYCHNEGNEMAYAISKDSLRKIVEEAKVYGLKNVRLTGGEPLVRGDIHDLCKMLVNEYNLNVSVNTNGICIDKLRKLVEDRLVTGVVFGIDKIDGDISKMSSIGLAAEKILQNVIELKKYNVDLSISMVYRNIDDVKKVLSWCISNEIRLKVLQQVVIGNPSYDDGYEEMVNIIMKEYELKQIFNKYEEKCGLFENRIAVCFYHSLCKADRCSICKNIHLRITADSKMLYCLQNKYEKVDLNLKSFEYGLKKLGYV